MRRPARRAPTPSPPAGRAACPRAVSARRGHAPSQAQCALTRCRSAGASISSTSQLSLSRIYHYKNPLGPVRRNRLASVKGHGCGCGGGVGWEGGGGGRYGDYHKECSSQLSSRKVDECQPLPKCSNTSAGSRGSRARSDMTTTRRATSSALPRPLCVEEGVGRYRPAPPSVSQTSTSPNQRLATFSNHANRHVEFGLGFLFRFFKPMSGGGIWACV